MKKILFVCSMFFVSCSSFCPFIEQNKKIIVEKTTEFILEDIVDCSEKTND